MNSLELLQNRAAFYANCVQMEAQARIELARTEAEITSSVIGTDNPMTGKAHSASSAAEYAKTSDVVLAERLRITNLERATIIARAEYEAARIAAWAEVKLVEAA